ncbi:DUF4232 domain-containing protein [Streptomyces sp. SID13726]|uniref:DUF4232 domain-containing protein n=1 Tax=Streptomyces sp. SID13726 TaxID=2706058 RepID=UPI0013B5FE04|nr:DUF4232 domain-containing protein [Streptomyces sp. SID13726]NEB00688.1 DUF4232 domain-containing protein [Streptomyces sp. SID13726]
MRAAPLAVTALAAALLLTACDDGGDKASGGGGKGCKIGVLHMEVGPANVAPAAGDTGDVPVTLTNPSAPCTLEGFPGIDLYAADESTNLQPTAGAKSQKLTLAKGDTATFTITYERGKTGGSDVMDVKTLKISLPGAPDQRSYKWPYGPVQAGDNPGDLKASVSAFTQAGD